jgi:pyridoxal phosphate enzyme (YggS family)
MTLPIAENLRLVRAAINAAAQEAGRDPAGITLVAVSKNHSMDAVRQAIAAGQTVFGENRVQEAAAKFLELKTAHPELALHLIGALQTNKADVAVSLFDTIEVLDRQHLADAIAHAADKHKRLPKLMIQVNLGGEPQKSGISWQEADDFIVANRARFGAALTGLMGIAPVAGDPLPYFKRLATLAQAYDLLEISMGMSGDFPAAIAAGATLVRVGTAIFGNRAQMASGGRALPGPAGG